LGQEERLRIADLRLGGAGVRAIARDLGRPASTISRELRRNSHPTTRSYRPYAAEKRCVIRVGRPKPSKLDDRLLAAAVEERLRKNWSPQQISDALAVMFAGQDELQVSHESMQLNAAGKIRDKVMPSERPKEANDRLVTGHWEGDLIVGSASESAIATLVERTTRFVVLVHLSNGHSSAELHDGLIRALEGLPALLRRSLT
jgi:IS30 family transposase